MFKNHILLKPTTRIYKDFSISEAVKDITPPEESIELSKKYLKSKKLSDELGHDMMMEFDDSVIFVFDFLHNDKKYVIPEVNPTTIFFSNAAMFYRNLVLSRQSLFDNSPTLTKLNKQIDLKIFGTFFQYAAGFLINLQSSVESFANHHIPSDHTFLDKNGNKFDPSINHKLDKVLPEIFGKRFRTKFKRDNFRVRKVIELRNEIIHLTPNSETSNTKYKVVYRKMIKFDFEKALFAVQNLINFYEPGLIEECTCGEDHFFEILKIDG